MPLSTGFEFWKGKNVVIYWPFPLKPAQLSIDLVVKSFSLVSTQPIVSKSMLQENDGPRAPPLGLTQVASLDTVFHLDSLFPRRYLFTCKWNTGSFTCKTSPLPSQLVSCPILTSVPIHKNKTESLKIL